MSGQVYLEKSSTVQKSLFRTEVVPFAAAVAFLLAMTLAVDLALHRADLGWVGRYLGIPGTFLIAVSFLYSLRKRKIIIRFGTVRQFLAVHEVCSWVGALMVLVHCGVHVNTILAWLAALSMVVAVVSGLTGRLLLTRSLKRLASRRENLRSQGLSEAQAEEELLWEALAVAAMKKWKVVHFPITVSFCVLAAFHVFLIFFFGEWI